MCTTSTYQSLICVLPLGIVVEPFSISILHCYINMKTWLLIIHYNSV
nr:MAG TPA: hypothetical protein [Caudoviricetes sp.]